MLQVAGIGRPLAWLMLSALAARAGGQVLVGTGFDAGPEGWSAFVVQSGDAPEFCLDFGSAVPASLSYMPAGGAPGGYILTPEAGDGVSVFRAPAAYSGDLSEAYGGSLRVEQRFVTTSSNIFDSTNTVYLFGDGRILIGDSPIPSRDRWGIAEIPFLPGYWRLDDCSGPFASESDIRGVLGAVTDLYLRAETVTGVETFSIDSVAVDATPYETGCPAEWEVKDVASPTGRWRHAMALDTSRGVLVIFGSDTGENDTWEYRPSDGVWTRHTPAVSPSRRGGHAMAYDPVRDRVVMTGGGYLVPNGEVWEYGVGSSTWTRLADLPGSPRSGHAMAYDAERGVMVVYGGVQSGASDEGAVLERSSATGEWVVRTAATSPGPQIGHGMAYDSGRDLTVLIGSDTSALRVWEWDGVAGSWAVRTPASPPSDRRNFSVVYDPSLGATLMMGGQGFAANWAYDGATWTVRAALPGGARTEHAAVYDPASSSVLVFGGIVGDATPRRDLLAFDGASNAWSTLWSPELCAARERFGMIYDEIGERCVVFGGGLVSRPGLVQQVAGGPYTFDGSEWTFLSTSGSRPGQIWITPLLYDPSRRTAMLYGGKVFNSDASASSRMWELNLATDVWTDLGNQPPGQRFAHAAAFDRARGAMIVHGGLDDLGDRLGDTWLYEAATGVWTALPAGAATPGLRNAAGIAYDESRQVVVLFGGYVGAGGAIDNSTWEWNGVEWTDVTPSGGNPPARFWPVCYYDPDRAAVVMYGGSCGTNTGTNPEYVGRPYTDLWEWDGTGWKRIEQSGAETPVARLYSNAAYDRTRNRAVHFGGMSVNNATYRAGQTLDLVLPDASCTGACPGDVNEDGLLNIFDIQAYLGLYGAQDPAADLAPPLGVFNIFDLQAYLGLYNQGCP